MTSVSSAETVLEARMVPVSHDMLVNAVIIDKYVLVLDIALKVM